MARLAARVANLVGSPVRDMLKVAEVPGMISFAGGLPAPESFSPLDLHEAPVEVLQYGPSEGDRAFREAVAAELGAIGLTDDPDRVLILSGSQQGIDLAAKLVVEPGTRLGVPDACYLAALQVFRLFGAQFVPLAPLLAGEVPAPSLAYINPTFQNPTGACSSLAERQALAAACQRHDCILFEDDPYRDLDFEPVERRPVASFMDRGSFIYQGSFSKTVAPGLRLGFLTASPDLLPKLVHLKQAADLHTNRLSQWLVLQRLQAPDRLARADANRTLYRQRRDHFAAELTRLFTDLADWEVPKGGFFFWLRLKGEVDASALLPAAIRRGVLFTPGVHFEPFREGPSPTLRLNFGYVTPETATRGLTILADLIREDRARQAA